MFLILCRFTQKNKILPTKSSQLLTTNFLDQMGFLAQILYIQEQNTKILAALRSGASLDKFPGMNLPMNLPVKLPLQTSEEVDVIEQYLIHDENKILMCSYLSTLGGQHAAAKTNRVMKTLLSDIVASNYSYYGKRSQKKPFSALQLKDLVIPKSQRLRVGPTGSDKSVKDANNTKNETKLHNQTTSTLNILLSNQSTLMKNVKAIMESQKTMMENQAKILKQLTKHQGMLDLVCNSYYSSSSTTGIAGNANETQIRTEIVDPFPIDSEERLEDLEFALKNEAYMNQMVERKSGICGTSGKMNGLNCCYSLIDTFFTRDLITKFSWTGSTRDADTYKSCFKKYENTMRLFFSIVHKADNAFSEIACKNFFKCIIKNSRRRAEIAQSGNTIKRMSASKKRPSMLQYKKRKSAANDGNYTASGNFLDLVDYVTKDGNDEESYVEIKEEVTFEKDDLTLIDDDVQEIH